MISSTAAAPAMAPALYPPRASQRGLLHEPRPRIAAEGFQLLQCGTDVLEGGEITGLFEPVLERVRRQRARVFIEAQSPQRGVLQALLVHGLIEREPYGPNRQSARQPRGQVRGRPGQNLLHCADGDAIQGGDFALFHFLHTYQDEDIGRALAQLRQCGQHQLQPLLTE
jgi:hypothetical protein